MRIASIAECCDLLGNSGRGGTTTPKDCRYFFGSDSDDWKLGPFVEDRATLVAVDRDGTNIAPNVDEEEATRWVTELERAGVPQVARRTRKHLLLAEVAYVAAFFVGFLIVIGLFGRDVFGMPGVAFIPPLSLGFVMSVQSIDWLDPSRQRQFRHLLLMRIVVIALLPTFDLGDFTATSALISTSVGWVVVSVLSVRRSSSRVGLGPVQSSREKSATAERNGPFQ